MILRGILYHPSDSLGWLDIDISLYQQSDIAEVLHEALFTHECQSHSENRLLQNSILFSDSISSSCSSICAINNLLFFQCISYKLWCSKAVCSFSYQHNTDNQSLLHLISKSLHALKQVASDDRAAMDMSQANQQLIDVAAIQVALHPESEHSRYFCDNVIEYVLAFNAFQEQSTVEKLIALLLSNSILCSSLDANLAYFEKNSFRELNFFRSKLFIANILSLFGLEWQKNSPAHSVLTSSISSVLSLWRDTLSTEQLQCLHFRSSLVKWVENSPELFLGMFLRCNDAEGCFYIAQKPDLLKIVVESDSDFHSVFKKEASCILSSTDIQLRLQLLRCFCRFVFVILQKQGTCEKQFKYRQFLEWLGGLIFREPYLNEAIDSFSINHLFRIFSTVKVDSDSFGHTNFVIYEDLEMSLYLFGLILLASNQYSFNSLNFISNTFCGRSTEIENSTSDSTTIPKALLLWKICTQCLLTGKESVSLESKSVAQHTVSLLRLWTLLCGLEKVVSVICFLNLSPNENLLPLLQCIQSLLYFLALFMHQLKYAQLYLGTGSLASIMSSKESGNMFWNIREIVEDGVSRSIIESLSTSSLPTSDVGESDMLRNVNVGISAPIGAAINQWNYLKEEIRLAMDNAVPVLLVSQITHIEPDLVKDDTWWEISLSSMCTSCFSLRSSLEEVMEDWEYNKLLSQNEIGNPVELLSSIFRGYQLLVSQEKQDQLKKVITKVKQIKAAAANDTRKRKPVFWYSQSMILQSILSMNSAGNASRIRDYATSEATSLTFDSDSDEGKRGDKNIHLRRILSLSSSNKQFASSVIAKQLAGKLVPHQHESYLQSLLHRFVAVMRPNLPSSEDRLTPYHQPLSKLLSFDIQELLWSLRSEWLELLQVSSKVSMKFVLNDLEAASQNSSVQELPDTWKKLVCEMLVVFSAELMRSAIVGVKKAVFENIVEVLYSTACALYPNEQELPLRLILRRRLQDQSVVTRDLARMLIVLQEVGASTDQKLQRALLNLILQLCGSSEMAWKIVVPYLVESCIFSLIRKSDIDFPNNDSSSIASDHSSASETHDESKSHENRRRSCDDIDESSPLFKRRQKVDAQVDNLDAYLQQQVVNILHLKQEDSAAIMMDCGVQLESCYLRFEASVAESLWIELFRRCQFDMKACMQLTNSPNIPLLSAEPDTREFREFFVAEHKLKVFVDTFLIVSSALFKYTDEKADRGSQPKFVLQDLPDKCTAAYWSFVNIFVVSLRQDTNRVFLPFIDGIPAKKPVQIDDLITDNNESDNKVPLSFRSSLPNSYSTEAEYISFSRTPLLLHFLEVQEEQISFQMLLLIKNFVIRQQFLIQEQLEIVSKQIGRFQDSKIVGPKQMRSPAPSVSRLLGLNAKAGDKLVSSPVNSSPKRNADHVSLQKRQSQFSVQLKKYDEILLKFASMEEELSASIENYNNVALGPEDEEYFFCITGILELWETLTKDQPSSPIRRKRRRSSQEIGSVELNVNEQQQGFREIERRQKLVMRSLQRNIRGSKNAHKKSRLSSRNKVVNAWLKETEGNDAYADLEDFLE